jgi:hypothetical protein
LLFIAAADCISGRRIVATRLAERLLNKLPDGCGSTGNFSLTTAPISDCDEERAIKCKSHVAPRFDRVRILLTSHGVQNAYLAGASALIALLSKLLSSPRLRF